MKLVTYQYQNREALGIIHHSKIVNVVLLGKKLGMDLPHTMIDFIDEGGLELVKILNEKIKSASTEDISLPPESVKLLAPIPKPRKNIFGIGLNYTEHVAESARALDTENKLPKKCILFSKPPTAVIATGDNIHRNEKVTRQLDYEGELAVIIGKKGFRVKKNQALSHVFGYSIINDVSARDCRREGQWIVSKGQDTFAPMGPCLVTADEIPDPQTLEIITKVNGVEKQHSNTRFMLFSVAAIIEDISEVMTLEPADIIASGTPAGVGAGRTPQEWLLPGDVVEITIDKIGSIKNQVIDHTPHE